MPDHEYDRLSIVTIDADGHARLTVERYGAALARAMSHALPQWRRRYRRPCVFPAKQRATQAILRDAFAKPLRTIAGFRRRLRGTTAPPPRAAAILLDADTLAIIDQQVARLPTRMPYIPGLLQFPRTAGAARCAGDAETRARPRLHRRPRHRPSALARHRRAFRRGNRHPQHRRRQEDPGRRGAHGPARHARRVHPLRDGKAQIGWLLLRSNLAAAAGRSPATGVAMPSAPELAMRYVTKYRLPEPTRLADRLLAAPRPRRWNHR